MPSPRTIARRTAALAALLVSGTLLAAAPASAALTLVKPQPTDPATFVGNGGFTSDALGQTAGGGTVQADVPAGSTVKHAYLYGTYANANGGVIPSASLNVTFDGSAKTLTQIASISDYLATARTDVTAQVAAKVGGGGGVTNFTINNDPPGIEGVALVVIYANPGSPEVTIAVLEGAAETTGDTASFAFASPLDVSAPDFHATMAVGSGFSWQGNGHDCNGPQISSIDVNDQRLTSCAGGTDDGVRAAAAAVTMGGVGDSLDRPSDPYASSGTDDELYDITSFLHQGDTDLAIRTANPSGDDDVFVAVMEVTAQATVVAGNPPATPTVGSAPSGLTNAPSIAPTFTKAAGDAATVTGFSCSLDGAAYADCTSGATIGDLDDGDHTLDVRAVGPTGRSTPAHVAWTVDATAPDAPTIDNRPATVTDATDAALTLAGEPGAQLECRVDEGGWAGCGATLPLAGLKDGEHSVSVRQRDAAGNTSAATTATWAVDTVAPDAPTVGNRPAALTGAADAALTIAGEKGGQYECRVDAGAWAPCGATLPLTGLKDGEHTVAVRQRDAAGNTGPATTATWTVDTVPPTVRVVDHPAPVVEGTAATFRFTGEEDTPFECQLDGQPWTACTSGVTFEALAAGEHTLLVRQRDAAGNTSTVLSTTWTVQPPAAPATTDAAPAAGPAPTAAPAACVSRRTVALHWRLPARVRPTAIRVTVNGTAAGRLRAAARSMLVNLGGLPRQQVTVTIRATVGGRVYAATRRYRTCAPKVVPSTPPTLPLTRSR